MSIWYQNHPSKELQAETYFHTLWLISIFFTNNSCFLPSFCYNLCYNIYEWVMVKYHDSIYARKSWSAAALGPVFASLTRRLLPSVPEGGTSRTYGLPCIKKELRKPSFPYIIFWDKGGSCSLSCWADQRWDRWLRWLYDRKRDGSLWDPQKKQRSDLALGTGTGCKDPGKKRIYRIHTERKCRCRDRSDHQHWRKRKPSFRELIWTETSILCDRKK